MYENSSAIFILQQMFCTMLKTIRIYGIMIKEKNNTLEKAKIKLSSSANVQVYFQSNHEK